MALKATIFKAELNIADMDRDYYGDHALTLARHPSETDERMMVRLLAFARHAHERLQFTRGLSADDEPDLWQKNLTDEIELWIDVGLPDEKRIRKACGRAQQVAIYAYGSRSVGPWWDQLAGKLDRFDNLAVYSLPKTASEALAKLAERNMRLQCSIQDGQIWVSDDTGNLEVEIARLL
jgi:uncharacterized protein YaeQ